MGLLLPTLTIHNRGSGEKKGVVKWLSLGSEELAVRKIYEAGLTFNEEHERGGGRLALSVIKGGVRGYFWHPAACDHDPACSSA